MSIKKDLIEMKIFQERPGQEGNKNTVTAIDQTTKQQSHTIVRNTNYNINTRIHNRSK